jgi:hypothetical protein
MNSDSISNRRGPDSLYAGVAPDWPNVRASRYNFAVAMHNPDVDSVHAGP